MSMLPRGLALYVRSISKKRHGTPKQFAARCQTYGLRWIALAGPWQDAKGDRWINSLKEVHTYGAALEAAGIEVYVWGYPWQGREDKFCGDMTRFAEPFGRVLLDPELGANPSRSTSAKAQKQAAAHAREIVHGLERRAEWDVVGFSTFGLPPRWFPLDAYADALRDVYHGRTFVGGQTYTSEVYVDRSIARFAKLGLPVVPNFGLYSWAKRADGKRRARRKTAEEQKAHLYEFINEREPVHAMIGWAENFIDLRLGRVLADFANLMDRGATCV